MRYFDAEGKEVEILDTEFIPGEGVYVMDAVYVHDEPEIHASEETLDYLTDAYQAELYEDAVEHAAARAYDMAKDFDKYGE